MKTYLSQNKAQVGWVVGIVSLLLSALVVSVVLWAVGQPLQGNVRWYALIFVPYVLILRRYVHQGDHLAVVKPLLILLFITFIAFITLYLKLG